MLQSSSVQCETTFSLMNAVKTKSRNQLGDEKLDDIIRIKCTADEEIDKVIENIVNSERDWLQINEREYLFILIIDCVFRM